MFYKIQEHPISIKVLIDFSGGHFVMRPLSRKLCKLKQENTIVIRDLVVFFKVLLMLARLSLFVGG